MRAWALLLSAAAHAGLVAAFPTGSALTEEPARRGIPVIFAAVPAAAEVERPPPVVTTTTPAPARASSAGPPPLPSPKPEPRPRVPAPAAMPQSAAAAPPPSSDGDAPPAAAQIAALPSPRTIEGHGAGTAPRPAAGIDANPMPDYPAAARRRGQEGTVRLRIEVASDGTAADAVVIESSGHRQLDEAALRAVRRWRFTPAMVADRPIATAVEIPIAFRLDGRR